MTLVNFLIAQGYDLKKANALIKAGQVMVNNQTETLPYFKLKSIDEVLIREKSQWVSRGALKLLKAIEVFKLDFQNQVVLDIGSSTGGFTQVALAYGAKKVYAVDVGTNQLAFKLRKNLQVKVMEKTNLKTLKPTHFAEKINIVVCDVSFITLKRVFEVLDLIVDSSVQLMLLIKPQYEASSNLVKNGKVDIKYHKQIIEDLKNYALSYNFYLEKIEKSPIKGKSAQNIEYLTLFKRRYNNEP